MSKKLLSLLLCLVMVLGSVGVPALAADPAPANFYITFQPNNNNSSNLPQKIRVPAGQEYKFPGNYLNGVVFAAPKGKVFSGWSLTTTNPVKETTIVPTEDITVYAIWINKSFDISFDLNGGKYNGSTTAPTTANVTFGERYSEYLPSPDPTKEGSKFDGWYTEADGGLKIGPNDTVGDPAPTTLHAHWLDQCTVKFDPNGGTLSETQRTYTKGDTYGTLPTPQKDGYTFDGWYTSTDPKTKIDSSAKVTDSITLCAEWTAGGYKVILNPLGGTGLDTTEFSIKYDEKYSDADTSGLLKKTLTRTGYTFQGWFTQRNGSGTQITDASGNIKDPDLKFTGTSNQTLYAYWAADSSTISFNANYPSDAKFNGMDGKPVATKPTPNLQSITASYGETIRNLPTLNAKTEIPTNYTFAGWYTIKEDIPADSDHEEILGKLIEEGKYTCDFSGSQTLYARWGYNIEFYANNTDDVTAEKPHGSMPCVIGAAYDTSKMPRNPSRSGYSFSGWFTAPTTGGSEVKLSSESIADASIKKLYAHWDEAKYTVTFDPNGGEFATGAATTTKVTYGKPYLLVPAEPTRTGYTFQGWFTEAAGGTKITSANNVTTASDHTLYAQWAPKAATVRLNFNFPAGFNDSSYKKEGLSGNSMYLEQQFKEVGLPLSEPEFTHDGVKYQFSGWYTTAEDRGETKGKQVNRETALTEDMVSGGLNVTLYARWSFDVSFYERADASSASKTVSCTTGSAYGSRLYTPTREGFTFIGWYSEPVKDGERPTVARIAETDPASPSVRKLYAGWSTSEYAITPDANGGTFTSEQTIPWAFNHGDTYGRYVTDPAYVPTPPSGRTFEGWYTEREGGVKLNADDKVTESRTIYAHWNAVQCKLTMNLNYAGSTDIVKSVDHGTELSKALPVPGPDRDGYAFEGWYTDKDGKNKLDTKGLLTGDLTVYAQWKEAQKVELNLGGGKLPEGYPSHIYVYENGTYEKLPTPTWEGCVFKGWWTAETGGVEIIPSSAVPTPSSIPETLYARWEAKQITVNFNYNGANGSRPPQTYSVGAKYDRLPAYLSWAGHQFMGWYTKAVGGEKIGPDTVVSIASDDVEEITLYAHWGYTVTFEPTDGDGEMEPVAAEMDQPFSLPTCTFTPPEGMRFGGWAIGTPDGPKQPGGSQYTVTRNLTLYATWTDRPITITVTCTSGGSLMTDDGKTNTVTVERGTDVTFIARANTGYELKDLQVDGVSFNYTDLYTFRNVIEDHAIHAVFGRIGSPAYITCDHGVSCPLAGYRDLDANAWYHDAVHYCMDNVIMNGTSSTTFKPSAKASRADVATALWSAMGRPPMTSSGPLSKTYPDVAASAWYYQPIEWASRQGVVAGYSNGRFGPDDKITREQLVSILWRHAGCPKPRTTVLRFNDSGKVSGYAWDAMLWATERGIMSGKPGGYLDPKGGAARVDVAQMLKNYLN